MKIKEYVPNQNTMEQVIFRKELSQTWAEWIRSAQYHFLWYGHFTFKDYPHDEAAHKVWMKFIHILNRKCFGTNYWKHKTKGVTWVRATEFQTRGSLHYHALIGNVNKDINRFDFMKLWESLAGFSRIYIFEVGKGAEDYICKSSYAFKQGRIDMSETIQYHIADTSFL